MRLKRAGGNVSFAVSLLILSYLSQTVNSLDFELIFRINNHTSFSDDHVVNLTSPKQNTIVAEVANVSNNDNWCPDTVHMYQNKTDIVYEIILLSVDGLNEPMFSWNEEGGPTFVLNSILMGEVGSIVGLKFRNNDKLLNMEELLVSGDTFVHNKDIAVKRIEENESFIIGSIDSAVLLSNNYNLKTFTYDLMMKEQSIIIGWHGRWTTSNIHVIAMTEGNTAEDIKNIYRKWAKHYNDETLSNNISVGFQSVVGELDQIYPDGNINHKKILDAACGTGLLGHYLRNAYINNTFILNGVDISHEMLEIAAYNNTYTELKECDIATSIPYFTNTFDIIVSTGTFYIGGLTINGLNEMLRVLKNNGTLITTMRCDYYDKYENSLNDIVFYNKFKVIKRIKKPYYGSVEAYVLIIST